MHLKPNSRLSYLLHNVWWPYAGQLSLTLGSQCDHKCLLCLWLRSAGPLTGFAAWRRRIADFFHNLVKGYKSGGVYKFVLSSDFNYLLPECQVLWKGWSFKQGKGSVGLMGRNRSMMISYGLPYTSSRQIALSSHMQLVSRDLLHC